MAQMLDMLCYDPKPAGLDRVGAGCRPGERPPGPGDLCRSRCGRPSTRLYRAIPSGQFHAQRPPAIFQWVRERAALINGTADATTVRDEGWQFLMLGRCVERAD